MAGQAPSWVPASQRLRIKVGRMPAQEATGSQAAMIIGTEVIHTRKRGCRKGNHLHGAGKKLVPCFPEPQTCNAMEIIIP